MNNLITSSETMTSIQISEMIDKRHADIKRGTPLVRAKAESKAPYEDHRTGGALAWRM